MHRIRPFDPAPRPQAIITIGGNNMAPRMGGILAAFQVREGMVHRDTQCVEALAVAAVRRACKSRLMIAQRATSPTAHRCESRARGARAVDDKPKYASLTQMERVDQPPFNGLANLRG